MPFSRAGRSRGGLGQGGARAVGLAGGDASGWGRAVAPRMGGFPPNWAVFRDAVPKPSKSTVGSPASPTVCRACAPSAGLLHGAARRRHARVNMPRRWCEAGGYGWAHGRGSRCRATAPSSWPSLRTTARTPCTPHDGHPSSREPIGTPSQRSLWFRWCPCCRRRRRAAVTKQRRLRIVHAIGLHLHVEEDRAMSALAARVITGSWSPMERRSTVGRLVSQFAPSVVPIAILLTSVSMV